MAVTISSFKARYPEFSKAGDVMLAAALTGVEAVVSVDAFASDAARDEYVMLSLAHALALSPMGRDAQLVAKDGKTTTYTARLSAMRDAKACLHPNRWGTLPE
jgi:hypothetical protein